MIHILSQINTAILNFQSPITSDNNDFFSFKKVIQRRNIYLTNLFRTALIRKRMDDWRHVSSAISLYSNILRFLYTTFWQLRYFLMHAFQRNYEKRWKVWSGKSKRRREVCKVKSVFLLTPVCGVVLYEARLMSAICPSKVGAHCRPQ